jgi:hypothetical protein
LLLEKGHTAASRYPIAVVWSETRIVRQREIAHISLDAVLLQMAIASNFSKKAAGQLTKMLKDIKNGD